MSDDLVRTIEEIIKSEKGDVGKLQDILVSLKNGNPLTPSDQEYVDSLTTHEIQNNENISEIPSTNDFQNLDKIPIKKSIPTKKYASVGVVIVILFVAYFGLDVYAVNMLQFRPHHGQQNIISNTELGIKSDACNPSYFPATFSKYEITAFYKSDEIEKATINGSTISPKSSATLDGIFALNKIALDKITKENIPFDAANATITTKVDAPIFGFIPYSVDKKYSAEEFQRVLNNGTTVLYTC